MGLSISLTLNAFVKVGFILFSYSQGLQESSEQFCHYCSPNVIEKIQISIFARFSDYYFNIPSHSKFIGKSFISNTQPILGLSISLTLNAFVNVSFILSSYSWEFQESSLQFCHYCTSKTIEIIQISIFEGLAIITSELIGQCFISNTQPILSLSI